MTASLLQYLELFRESATQQCLLIADDVLIKYLFPEKKKLSYKHVRLLLEQLGRDKPIFSKDSELILHSNRITSKKIFRVLNYFELPQFHCLRIDATPEEDHVINELMTNFTCPNLNIVQFRGIYDDEDELKPLSCYIEGLKSIAPTAKKHFLVKGWVLNEEDFSSLVIGARH